MELDAQILAQQTTIGQLRLEMEQLHRRVLELEQDKAALYERVAQAELARARLTRSLADAVGRKIHLESDNAVMESKIEELEHRNRFCRMDKAAQIHRAVLAEQRLKELEGRPDLTAELASQVRDLEEKLNRMRLESAEQITRATVAEDRVRELEGRVGRLAKLEAAVAYLEKKNKYGLEERAAQIHRAVTAEQRLQAASEANADLDRRIAVLEAAAVGCCVFEV